MIIGQAPGVRAHASGVPWDDASGQRLREWMGVDEATFYGSRIAIMPMGFCYPGTGKSGDLPPRPECAPAWHKPLLQRLPNIHLTLLVGGVAQRYYLAKPHKTLTETVKTLQYLVPEYLPLPHPSPRNNIWLKKNPWFTTDVLPTLRREVAVALETP